MPLGLRLTAQTGDGGRGDLFRTSDRQSLKFVQRDIYLGAPDFGLGFRSLDDR